MKTILHLDMNSYFATAEQQANPYLRGKPVGIIKAAGRGCVIAASVEAKKFGVKTGTTVWEARKLCPQITFVPSDMDKYLSLTHKMIEVVNDYSPTMEVFSIDEVFADVSQSQECFSGGAMQIALEIKQRLRQELGEWMRASIGISFTRLTAKLASEMKKPDGLTWLTPENYLTATEGIKVEDVCGIGQSRTAYLRARGAYFLGQARRLLDLPPEIAELVWLKLDEPLTAVEEVEPAKSVSRTYTTYKELRSEVEIERLVRNLVEEAAAKLREMGMAGRTFGLNLSSSLRQENFWQRLTTKTSTDDGLVVFDLLWKKFRQSPPLPGVRFAGVWISNLVFNYQLPIFKRRRELLAAVDKVNSRHGLFTVYPARLMSGELIRPEVTGFLGDKWYRFGQHT